MKCEELAAIMERAKASPSMGYAYTHYKADVDALLLWIHDLECKAEILHDQLTAANLQNNALVAAMREALIRPENWREAINTALNDLDPTRKRVDPAPKAAPKCEHGNWIVDGDRDICGKCGARSSPTM